MMITRRVVSLRQPLLRGVQVRCQGSAAFNETPSNSTPPPPLHHMQSATIASTPRCDASSMALKLKRDSGDYYFEEHSEAFLSAFNVYDDMQESENRVTATARDMNLIEASLAVRDESYDKILILMRHGEAKHNVFESKYAQEHGTSFEQANEDEDYPVDPMLTGKGCGTMLNVSKRAATFFNKETGLLPDLFVVSPLRRAIQSALISFPHDAPLTSLSGTPWICHPSCMEQANGNKSEFVSSPDELEQVFPGIDYELFKQSLMRGDVYNSDEKVPLFESKIDLMNRTDSFLEWIKERDERVIVVSSHATWLQSLCAFSLQYEESDNKSLEMFKKGEMRAAAIKFS